MGMRHKTSETLFAYWNGVRGEHLAPRQFQIEPAKISGILSSTFMLERLGPATYRYRLAGTTVCNMFGAELRGTNFLDGWPPEDHLSLMRRLSVLSGRGAVELIHLEAAPAGRPSVAFELLLLPLRHTGEAIDRVPGLLRRTGSPELARACAAGNKALDRERVHLAGRQLEWHRPRTRTGPIAPQPYADAFDFPRGPHRAQRAAAVPGLRRRSQRREELAQPAPAPPLGHDRPHGGRVMGAAWRIAYA